MKPRTTRAFVALLASSCVVLAVVVVPRLLAPPEPRNSSLVRTHAGVPGARTLTSFRGEAEKDWSSAVAVSRKTCPAPSEANAERLVWWLRSVGLEPGALRAVSRRSLA
jgi:hypothetical protein